MNSSVDLLFQKVCVGSPGNWAVFLQASLPKQALVDEDAGDGDRQGFDAGRRGCLHAKAYGCAHIRIEMGRCS